MKTRSFNKLHYTLLFLIVAVLPLVMFPDGTRFNIAKSKSLVLALIMLTYVITSLIRKDFRFELEDKENKLLFIYLGILVLASFFAHNKLRAFFGSPARLDGVVSFLGYMTAYYLARRVGIKDVFFKAMLVTSLLVCGFAILQFFELDPKALQLYPNSWKGFAFSTFGNPNFLASYLVLMLPIGLYYFFFRNKAFGLLSYAIVLFTLLATETRGAWIGGAFGVLAMLIFAFIKRDHLTRRKMTVIIILSLIVLIIFSLSSDHALIKELLKLKDDVEDVITSPETANTAGTNRFYIWQKCFILIGKKPILGYGPENMSYAMREFFHDDIVRDFGKFLNWDKAHNEYINIMVSSGILSLIVYLAFLGSCIIKGLKKIENPIYILLLCMIIGYMVQAFFNIQMVSVYYMFFAALGFLTGRQKKKKRTLYRVPSSFKVISA